MTGKDPKDMTASEQLRWAANGEPYNGIDENIWTCPTGKIKAPEEAVPMAWCDRCRNWEECPCGCGWGWCSYIDEFTEPDRSDECGGFDGEPPEMDDDPRIDMLREEGNDDDR